MQHICRRKCNIFVGPVQRIYYVCKPCAAFVSAFADCAHNTFSSTAQSIFAGPALNLYATSAHHIPVLFGFGAKHIGKLCAEHICRPWAAYWYIGRPVQHTLSSRNWCCISMGCVVLALGFVPCPACACRLCGIILAESCRILDVNRGFTDT